MKTYDKEHSMDQNTFKDHLEKIFYEKKSPELAEIFLKKYENSLTKEQKKYLKDSFMIEEPTKSLEELRTDFIGKLGRRLRAHNKEYVEELLETKIETREKREINSDIPPAEQQKNLLGTGQTDDKESSAKTPKNQKKGPKTSKEKERLKVAEVKTEKNSDTRDSFYNASDNEEPKAEGTQPVVTRNTLTDDLAIRLVSESKTEHENTALLMKSLPGKMPTAINKRAREVKLKMIEIGSSDKQGDSKLQESEKHTMDGDTFKDHLEKIFYEKKSPELAEIFLKKYENSLTKEQKKYLKDSFMIEEPTKSLEELTTDFIGKFGQSLKAYNKEYVEKLLGRNIETTGKEESPLPDAVQTTSTPQRHGSSNEHSPRKV